MADDLLFRRREVCRLLGIKKSLCFKLLANGTLDKVRIGPRAIGITRASVERLITNGAPTATPKPESQPEPTPPRGEWRAAQAAVAEAEHTLVEVRKHSRAHLVAAYLNRKSVDAAMTGADAKGQLDLRTAQLRSDEEIERALTFEIADLESNVLPEHRRRRDQAAGALVYRVQVSFSHWFGVSTRPSPTPRCPPLPRGTAAAGAARRPLCSVIEANQPSGAGRWGGWPTDEKLVSDWTNAIGRLLVDGDALLPGDSYKIDRDDGNPSSSPVRGGPRPPRQRAQDAARPSGRPARRRAGGKRMVSSSVRRRSPASATPSTTSGGRQKKRRTPARRRVNKSSSTARAR